MRELSIQPNETIPEFAYLSLNERNIKNKDGKIIAKLIGHGENLFLFSYVPNLEISIDPNLKKKNLNFCQPKVKLTLIGNIKGFDKLTLSAKSIILDKNCDISAKDMFLRSDLLYMKQSKITAETLIADAHLIKSTLDNELKANSSMFAAYDLFLENKSFSAINCICEVKNLVRLGKDFKGKTEDFELVCQNGRLLGALESDTITIKALNNFEFCPNSKLNFKMGSRIEANNELIHSGSIQYDKAYSKQYAERRWETGELAPHGYLDLHAKIIRINGKCETYNTVLRALEKATFNPSANVETDHRFIVSAKNIYPAGRIHSKDFILLNAQNETILAKKAEVTADNTCQINSQNLILSNAKLLAKQLNIDVKKEIILDQFAKVKAEELLNIKTDLFRNNNGKLKSENLNFDVNGFYAKSGRIKSGILHIKASNLFNDIHIYGRDIYLNIADAIEFSDHALIKAKNNLAYRATNITNRGMNKARNIIDVDAKKKVVNHHNGQFILKVHKAHKKKKESYLRITGNSLWNTGHITANTPASIALNRVLINGFSEKGSLSEIAKACIQASIKAEDLNIIAAATINVGGHYIADNDVNISSLVNVLVGLNEAWHLNVNSLLSLNAGAILPNPAKLSYYLKTLAKADFHSLSDNILTQENFINCASLIITALKCFVPQVGTGLSIAWNAILICKQLPTILAYCKSLYDKRKNIQFRDIIPLIVMCKSVLMQAINTASMSLNFMPMLHEKFQTNFDAQTLANTAFILGMSLAPSYQDNSLIHIGLPGVSITGNNQSLSFINIDSKYAWEIGGVISKNFLVAEELGTLYTNTLTMAGQKLNLGGKIKSNQSYINVSDLKILDEIDFQKAYISTSELEQQANLNLKQSHLQVKKQHHIVNDATLNMQESAYQAEHTTIDGTLKAETSALNTKVIETHSPGSSLILDKSSLHTETVYNHGILQAVDTSIKSLDCQLENKVLLKNVDMKIVEGINIVSDTQVSTDNVGIKAKEIHFDGKGEVQHILQLTAKDTLHLGNRSSLSGDNGTLILTATTENLAGKIDIGTLAINTDLANYQDLLGAKGEYQHIQPKDLLIYNTHKAVEINEALTRPNGISVNAKSIEVTADITTDNILAFQTTLGDLNLAANLYGKKGLYASAAHDLTTGEYDFTTDQTLLFATEHNYINRGLVKGYDTFISAGEDITNFGGSIIGTNYLQIDAQGFIYNTCLEANQKGSYDIVKLYQPGALLGGMGDGYDQGALIYAKKKIINDASIIAADGTLNLCGEEGIESAPRTHQYISYEKKKKSGGIFKHKKKKTTIISTQIEKPIFASNNDRVNLYSKDGPITLTATHILSDLGTDIYARQDNVNLYDVVSNSQVHQSKSSWWGLNKSSHEEYHEVAVPTYIANIDPGLTRIHTLHAGDINMRGVVIQAPGTTEIGAAHDINISTSILNHEMKDKQSSFVISAFGIPLIGKPLTQQKFFHDDPTISHLTQLANSHGIVELGLNGMNTAVELTNTINTLSDAMDNSQFLSALSQRYFGSSFEPKFDFSWQTQQSDYHYQTLGEGGITTDDLELSAGKAITIHASPLFVNHDMKVNAESFNQLGVALQSKLTQKSHSTIVSFTPNNIYKPDVGSSSSQLKMQNTIYQLQTLFVGGNLAINTFNWNIADALVNTGTLKGETNELDLTSHLNITKTKALFHSWNTNGNLSFQKMNDHAAFLKTPTEIHVRGDLTDADFQVNTITMTGSKLISDGKVDLSPKQIKVYDVNSYRHTHQYGFSFNPYDFVKDEPTSWYPHILNPKPYDHLKTFNLNESIENTKQTQHSVIFGSNGTTLNGEIIGHLHTSSADGSGPLKVDIHHYQAEIPLPTKSNFARLEHAFAKTFTNANSKNRDLLYQHLTKILNVDENVAEEKVNQLFFMASIIYNEDLGNAKANTLDLSSYGEYIDPATSTHVAVYVDNNNDAYILFRGSDGGTSVLTDDVDLLFGPPGSTMRFAFQDFMTQQINQLKASGYHIYLTGHSRGAAQAAVCSSNFHLPAILFDNPGLPNGGYDLSRVISFQADPNLVNAFPKLTANGYDYGAVWLLPETNSDVFINILLNAASHNPYLAGPAAIEHLLTTHRLDNIGKRLEIALEKGAGGDLHFYRAEPKMVFFKKTTLPKAEKLASEVLTTVPR